MVLPESGFAAEGIEKELTEFGKTDVEHEFETEMQWKEQRWCKITKQERENLSHILINDVEFLPCIWAFASIRSNLFKKKEILSGVLCIISGKALYLPSGRLFIFWLCLQKGFLFLFQWVF